MKKILSLVLAMLMIFSMVPAVFAADASESDYQAAIEYLKAIELYKGTTDGDAADELVERYQMALFTARMVTGRVDTAYWETDANDSGFTDIDALNAEALGGVCYAAQQGIVNGIGGSEFAPFDNVTYRDAIVMIVRALGFNYPDSGYPWSYINKARELGVLDGITGVSYTAEVKREVIAQLLYNAMNAEIKGETIAASVFGVEETIVMVTASPDGIVYGALSSRTNKSSMVRVAAIDAEGEPMGTEYYVPFKALGLKNNAAANAAVGTIYKLTHKGNFSQFLAYESLTQVFENTTEKKDVKVSNDKITLGADTYVILGAGEGYTSLVNNQGTVSGSDEIKLFKSFGAKLYGAIAGEDADGYDLYFGADGNIYSVANPFVPYAVYSDVVDAWFLVAIDAHGVTRYILVDDEDDLLERVTADAKGFSQLDKNNSAYIRTRIASSYGVDYDYYRATASDIDGDGDFDRAIIRQYQLFKFVKGTRDGLDGDDKTTKIDTFTLTAYGANGLTANCTTYPYGPFDAEYSYDYETKGYQFFRFTGIAYNKLPDEGFVVAYFAPGVDSEQEFEVVDVADKMSAYIRGYDQESDSVIYGSEYESIKLGYFGVEGTSLYRATQCSSKDISGWKLNSAKYVRKFWNKYVDMYVLNDAVICIEDASAANDYVILESFTNFSEEGMTAVAYSTKAGGKAEILVNELNGWNLGGFDYALYEEMLRLQALLPGLGIQTPVLPVELNKVYAVRYVDENGAYNLVEPGTPTTADIYVNNYGYILGVDKDGNFGNNNRVATSDKDLWFILKDGKVLSFQGKLASIRMDGAQFYKAQDNQFVLVADGIDLGPIMGNTTEGVDYFQYNTAIDNAYRNENYFGTFYYGHAMMNVRQGTVGFVTYDPVLVKQLAEAQDFLNGRYIHMSEGDIYQTVNGVLKSVQTYEVADVAALHFAAGTYAGKGYTTYIVGSVLNGVNSANSTLPTGITEAYSSDMNLRYGVAAHMYEEIYNRDFTNGELDVYETEIMKELLKNVIFVNVTDSSRDGYTGVKSDNSFSSERTLGSATHYVKAYAMYDYANKSAWVFIDSKNPIPATTVVVENRAVGTANAKITAITNNLTETTSVSIQFNTILKNAVVTATGVDASAITTTTAGANFTVATPDYDVANITITGDALGVAINGLAEAATDGKMNNRLGTGTIAALFDHVYTASANWNDNNTKTTLRHSSFVNLYAEDFTRVAAATTNYKDLVAHTGGSAKASDNVTGAKYWSAYTIELPAAEVVKGFRLVQTAHAGTETNMLIQSFDVLVSVDGTSWTKVAEANDLVNSGAWKYTAGGEFAAYFTCDVELNNTTAVKFVRIAISELSSVTGLGTKDYMNLQEMELFK